MNKGIEISINDIQKAFELVGNHKQDSQGFAYCLGWAHALNVLHKQGYFTESNMDLPPYFKEKKLVSTPKDQGKE